MATEFVTARFPEAEMPRVQSQRQMMQRVHRFVKPGTKARLRVAGDQTFGPWRRERDLADRIIDRVEKQGLGPKLIVQRQDDLEQLSIREVTAVPDLGAHPGVEQMHADVFDRFDVRSGGLWLCRFVDGTTTVSKHGFVGVELGQNWKGAAEDIFVNSGGMPALVEVAMFVVKRARDGEYDLGNAIVDQSIFSAPTYAERVYGGRQHYHGHFDFPGGAACSP